MKYQKYLYTHENSVMQFLRKFPSVNKLKTPVFKNLQAYHLDLEEYFIMSRDAITTLGSSSIQT